jgi:hypothetical protein
MDSHVKHRFASAGLGLCLLLVTTACGPQPETYRPEPQYPRNLAAHMSEHFIAAMDLETAIIRGQLADGKQHAEWLAAHRPHRDLPGASGPWSAAVRAAAAEGAGAGDIPELASAAARMASACGDCHAATNGQLDYLSTRPPEDSESVSNRMVRHVWAADRMWESLIRRSDELWSNGARVLQSSVISARDASWDPDVEAAIRPAVAELEDIAGQAASTGDWSGRAELMGSLLTTCSRCHQTLGIDPLGLSLPGPLHD